MLSVIAGFDPGETSALAVVDIDGRLIFLKTFRGGFRKAVELLRGAPKPAIVASDKTHQSNVAKLAASFNAKAFFPKKHLTVAEKAKLVRGFDTANDHERDALAAALNARKTYQRLIRSMKRIERDIFLEVLRGREANPKDALKRKTAVLRGPPRGAKTLSRSRMAELESLQRQVASLQRRLKAKQLQLDALREQARTASGRSKTVQKPRRVLSGVAKAEREARLRVEARLKESHSRLLKIEAELQALKRVAKTRPEKVKDIRERIIAMIKAYKERFR